jgi:type IX secretion system PorP/SprF family membrane protein
VRKILFLFVLLGVSNVEAQQDAQFTQYMYNTVNVNPAYAGSRGVLSIFGTHRAQWVGLEGAPTTSAASIHSPINNSKVGLGLSVIQDEIGPSDKSIISADFSYTINTSENYKLSFGLKGTASLFNVDYTKLNRYDLNDPRFQNNIDNQFSPNIGTGVYYHSDKLYAGVSVPFILETKHFNDNASSVAKDAMHYYFIGGYVFDLSETTKFKPAFLAKSVKGAPLHLDLTANFMFNDKFVVGGAWRWSAALSGLVGFQVNENWFIGYTYDTDTTKLANYNSGSHEFFLRYEFKGKQEKIVSPRFF